MYLAVLSFFLFKQKTSYEMCSSDWSSDVCSSDLLLRVDAGDATEVDGVELGQAEIDQLDAALLGDLADDIGLADAGGAVEHHGLVGIDQVAEGGGDLGDRKSVV